MRLIALLFCALLASCGSEEKDTGECTHNEMLCVGEQVQTCEDGVWGDPEDCPEGTSCMEMDDGMQHCM